MKLRSLFVFAAFLIAGNSASGEDQLDDSSDAADAKQIERLLKSPHYGERWGRIWLDAARYADSDGYEKDKPREMWFYRDWELLDKQRRRIRIGEVDAKKIVDSQADEVEPLSEHAAWTLVARVLLSLDETITKE